MNNLTRILTLITAVGAAAALSAQTATDTTTTRGPRGRGPGGPGGRGGHPIIRAIDVDKDREVSATELANASAGILTLDKNADGAVSADELHPQRPANDSTDTSTRPARDDSRPKPTDPVMLALDANSDGALSATEIANAAKSLAALDANKDGKLTQDELRPLPPTSE